MVSEWFHSERGSLGVKDIDTYTHVEEWKEGDRGGQRSNKGVETLSDPRSGDDAS